MANPLAIVEHKRIALSDLNTLLSNVLPVQQLNEIIFLKNDDIITIKNVIVVDNYICLEPNRYNVCNWFFLILLRNPYLSKL